MTCGPKTQRERAALKYSRKAKGNPVSFRKSMDLSQITEIIKSQLAMSEKRTRSDLIIDNNKGVEHTYLQIDLFLAGYYKHSIFYILILSLAVISIILPVLIKYKGEAKETSQKIKTAIDTTKETIEKID